MYSALLKIILGFIILYIFYIIIKNYDNKKVNKKKESLNEIYYFINNNPNNFTTDYIIDIGLKLQMKNDIHKAIELYNIAYNRGDLDSLVYLGDIYYESKNNTKKALDYYYIALKNGYYDCLLNMGDIYIYGLNNVKENKNLAYKCYNALVSLNIPCNSEKARERMDELNNEYDNYINSFTATDNYTDAVFEKDTLEATINNLINNTIVPKKPKKIKNKTHHVRIRNDKQNVHDHVVSNTVLKSIKKLKKKTSITKDLSSCLRQLRQAILNSDHKKQVDAINTLDKIERYNVHLSNYNMSEVDAIHLVWNRIHNTCNDDRRQDLINNLINELVECNEKNQFTGEKKQVCSTGRFTRIIDSLNQCDSENIVNIKPKFALNKEMMNKAALTRQKLINSQDDAIKNALNNPTPSKEDEIRVDNFYAILKKNIIDNFITDYVKTGLMSQQILRNEVDKWIDLI